MDFDTQQLVREAVLLKASHGNMFTAHDITRAVRTKLGRRVEVPHHDVKLIVHEMFEGNNIGSDYTRTMAIFPGVSPLPWIYHKVSDDPRSYKRPDDALPKSPFGGSISVGSPSDMCLVDARETLCIPARHIRAIDLKFGSTAYVRGDSEFVFVSKEKPTDDHAHYVVDHNNNVRITQGTLRRFGQAGSEFYVETEGNQIKITRMG